MDTHLSPTETAKRFGISIKALRLYEQRGLLTPLRTTNGSTGSAWRIYGPDQIARLHQILTLKRLGLSLARIGEVLRGADRLEAILELQESHEMMKTGDQTSPAALELARRWVATTGQFSEGDPVRRAKIQAIWQDALDDPAAASKLALNREIFAFVDRAIAHLKALDK